REQPGWTGARASAGPQGGPQTSPRRREAGRREQASRDSEKRRAVGSSPDGPERGRAQGRRAARRPARDGGKPGVASRHAVTARGGEPSGVYPRGIEPHPAAIYGRPTNGYNLGFL